ncbi:MAG: 50S ribosomal protein L6 [Saprospiraceae bacterium]|nr:50S ribosomal protein L6 [Saprospiraceae bacterium]MBK9044761.1 50S ribosomal protein L6 [Saprospiraceae bacterium]
MSRIGKAIVSVPDGVSIDITKGNFVTVKGKNGTLTENVDPDLTLKVEDGVLSVERPTEQKRHKAAHGLYRSLLNNMVVGVSTGFRKQLELIGVGYRVSNTGNLLELTLGYSHPIIFEIPDDLSLTTKMEKGEAPTIILEGADKQLLGQVCAKIRKYRKPEPYKGKGIKFSGEIIRRKAGKTSGKKK